MDLFENYEAQPQTLQAIFTKWDDEINNGLTYIQCKKLLREVEAIGFTFEYDLSGEPYDLKPLEKLVKPILLKNSNNRIVCYIKSNKKGFQVCTGKPSDTTCISWQYSKDELLQAYITAENYFNHYGNKY